MLLSQSLLDGVISHDALMTLSHVTLQFADDMHDQLQGLSWKRFEQKSMVELNLNLHSLVRWYFPSNIADGLIYNSGSK